MAALPQDVAGRTSASAGGEHAAGEADALATLLAAPGRRERVRHVHRTPATAGTTAPWPAWAHPEVVAAFGRAGVGRPWAHQVEVAEHVRAGRHVVVATGTASGKSLSYQLPALTRLLERGQGLLDRPGVLYVSPTKALAADQLAALTALRTGAPAAVVDGDSSPDARAWARRHAGYLLTNPDMLHFSMLPQHARWASFWRGLEVVVVDEMHRYRGVFGAQVAAVLRRVRRVAAHHGAHPTFVLASATAADPAATARRLTGLDVVAVQDDTSRRAGTDLVLWEPATDEAGTRTSTTGETAALLADLVDARVRSLAFVRSRRGAESVALAAARDLEQREPGSGRLVQAYRGGYLPEERRHLEEQLRTGATMALASTNALELGVDISGLDAVLVAGWPGTRSSLWQQAGRAGRAGTRGLAVLVAADDPLDTYLVSHPEELVGAPVEATVLDPDNPHVLAPHLCAAAAELPLTDADLDLFGPSTGAVLPALVRRGLLRQRASGWFWTHPTRATDLTDLRGGGGDPVQVVERSTGRVLGTVDAAAADHTVHEGAVYLHRGSAYQVVDLDLAASTAAVEGPAPPWTTHATSVGDIRVLEQQHRVAWGAVGICLGTVEVTSRVTGYTRRRLGSGERLGEHPLDLPERRLRTTAVWWTLPDDVLLAARIDPQELPGAVHAAEHCAIGLLPLVATCDRWDVGGVSTALHPDTGTATVFVHDAFAGGAGFAERGWLRAQHWLTATLETLRACPCRSGCPSCVQSPKCGNGNEPLDKDAATRLLATVLASAPGAGVAGRAEAAVRH